MRNLLCVQEYRAALERCGVTLEDSVFGLDVRGTQLLCASPRELVLVDLATGTVVRRVSLAGSVAAGVRVVDVALGPESEAAIVALSSGDLVSVPVTGAPECVGSVDSGVLAMSWSPDGEVAVLVTGNATLFALSSQWLPVFEVPLRHATDAAPLTVSLSWEATGERFVTHATWADGSSAAAFWARQGTQLAVCELPAGGGSVAPIAFRPSGFLAVVPHTPSATAHFYECNGLQHGGFALRRPEPVSAMCWSSDSTLLAMLVGTVYVQVWRSSNYHWHLAAELPLAPRSVLVGWSQSHPARLVAVDAAQGVRCWDFVREVFCAPRTCLTCVVDGTQIRLTPLKTKLIPPPMADATCDVANFVASHVATRSTDDTCAALAPSGRVTLFRGDAVTHVWTGAERSGDSFHQLAWLDHDVVVLVARSALYALHTGSGDVVARSELSANDTRRVVSTDGGQLLLLAHGPRVSRVVVAEASLALELMVTLPEPCLWLAANSTHIVALSARHRLYACARDAASGAQVLETECTAFALHDHYVVLTTLKSKLRFASLSSLPLCVNPALDREVDTGAQLVCCVANGARTVVQAPRGNLEVVYPRALIAHAVGALLSARRYGRALELMRKHKLDLAGLVATESLFDARDFVAQVTDADRLCLFLTQLGESATTPDHVVSRVCAAMREAMLEAAQDHRFLLPLLTSHVLQRPPQVEEALRVVMRLREQHQAEAATRVYTVAHPRANKDVVERALDYLTFLVKPHTLFDTALGMYDFALVSLVARKCQLDPNEYVPFLESLRALSGPRMRFTIDCRLRRWERALEHLAQEPGTLAECVALVREHRLYRPALQHVFAADDAGRRAVWRAYGEYLADKNHTVEAALCFERAHAHGEARQCYVDMGDWAAAGAEALADAPTRAALVRTLESQGRWEDLARLLSAPGSAASAPALAAAGLWAEARLAGLEDERDRLGKALVEAISLRRGNATRFEQMLARLRTLRGERAAWATVQGGVEASLLETPSEYSDVSNSSRASSATSASARSSASSLATLAAGRARDRLQKNKHAGGGSKRVTGKPGSMHEEEWLCRELRALVPTEEDLRATHRLCVALMRAGLDAEAAHVQRTQDALVAVVDAATATLLEPALVFGLHGQRHWEHWRPAGLAYMVAEPAAEDGLLGPDVLDANPTHLVPRTFAWRLVLLEQQENKGEKSS